MNSKNLSKNDFSLINRSLISLKNHIELKNYKGFDPYDCLKSPVFKLPIFNSNKYIRFLSQQFLKRFPLNLRKILLIKEGLNPVTLGLSLQSYSYLFKIDINNKNLYLSRIDKLIQKLEELIPVGFSGACWGYDFDWEARYMKIPAYQPSLVATGIISNALFITYLITKNEKACKMLLSSTNFLKKDINRSYENEKICFSYSPFDHEKVFNASMKGVRLLSQDYFLTGDPNSKMLAKKAIEYVMSYQNGNGSWEYGLAKKGNWIDSYHSGYVLDCLKSYQKLTKDYRFQDNLDLGFKFFRNSFVTKEGIPKFYNNQTYPVDCTSAAQLITTLVHFGDSQNAFKIAKWMILNMQKEDGSFMFRIFEHYKINTSYMRWSNAWMFKALSMLRSQ